MDERWDFYDWYVLDAGDALRLRARSSALPRIRPRARWSGFAWTGYGDGTEVHRVAVEIENGLPKLVARGRPPLRHESA